MDVFTRHFLCSNKVSQFRRSVQKNKLSCVDGCPESITYNKSLGVTEKYDKCRDLGKGTPYVNTQVFVHCKDVVDLAVDTLENYEKVAVLNLDRSEPQKLMHEEQEADPHKLSLHLRTTLSSVFPGSLDDKCCFYTEGVKVIRKGMNDGYEFIQGDLSCFDVVSTRDLRLEKVTKDIEAILAFMRAKYDLVFNVCAQKGVEVLIVDCDFGAFSGHAACVLHSIVELYAGHFREVCFTSKNESAMAIFAEELTSKVYVDLTKVLPKKIIWLIMKASRHPQT